MLALLPVPELIREATVPVNGGKHFAKRNVLPLGKQLLQGLDVRFLLELWRFYPECASLVETDQLIGTGRDVVVGFPVLFVELIIQLPEHGLHVRKFRQASPLQKRLFFLSPAFTRNQVILQRPDIGGFSRPCGTYAIADRTRQ